MLLLSPEDMAMSSIRQAMTELIEANRSLVAQELRLTLQKHVHSTTGGALLYPSWLQNGTSPPHQIEVSAPGSEDRAVRMAIHHLSDACIYFASADMTLAARSCMEFGARLMEEQVARREHGNESVDRTHVITEDSKKSGVGSWWGM
ncbi:hypothetical protein VM1G_11534 [Cytospora mali]|uniref:Uncharacterized protein n=1 Tax=Cytospora mali TaxID=578113 RepID=A0A194VW91_CYTMA|nr:hypothetical protein VM1G_11534 [Valsa mali]